MAKFAEFHDYVMEFDSTMLLIISNNFAATKLFNSLDKEEWEALSEWE